MHVLLTVILYFCVPNFGVICLVCVDKGTTLCFVETLKILQKNQTNKII